MTPLLSLLLSTLITGTLGGLCGIPAGRYAADRRYGWRGMAVCIVVATVVAGLLRTLVMRTLGL